jgi:hypothetical protein
MNRRTSKSDCDSITQKVPPHEPRVIQIAGLCSAEVNWGRDPQLSREKWWIDGLAENVFSWLITSRAREFQFVH